MSAKPRAFEPRRLLRAVRGNLRVLAVVVLLALLAGAALARFAIPNQLYARATARIVREPHAVVTRARSDELLREALRRAGQSGSPEVLRTRLELDFRAADQLHVGLSAQSDEAGAIALTNKLVELYVEQANHGPDARVAAADRARSAELTLAHAEYERAHGTLRAALAREGYPELFAALTTARARLDQLEREATDATSRLAATEGQLRTTGDLGREHASKQAHAELATAQRSLSALLAQHDPEHPEVEAARKRLERLQGQTVELTNTALKQRLEANTLAAEARASMQRAAHQRGELAKLQQVSARVAPLSASEERARAHLRELEAQAHTTPALRSAVASPAALKLVDRRMQRMLMSLVAGVVAALSVLGFFVLGAVRGFRICAPTELAYWLGVPVLASSAWPRRADALESLVDELADPAIAARGVVLVLPLSEAERPLAATLCVQLNARAQRHFRSTTGSRVTIAQPWLGELGSSRIKRAAEAADRVLWVVAADTHRGSALRQGRGLVGRHEGVAAVLVDSDSSLLPRVGNALAFWGSRAPVQVVSSQVRA